MRAINSVLCQSLGDFELIVVDDASTDATPSLLAAVTDPRLRVLRLPQNRGAAGARNEGIQAAVGEWIAFQDSDDEWLPGKLEAQYGAATSGSANVGLVLGGYEVETDRARLHIRPRRILNGGDPRPDLLDGWPIITPTWFVRRSLMLQLGGFDVSYRCLEDWDLVFRLSDHCAIRAVPGPVLIKHGSVDSVCADSARVCEALQRILQVHRHRWSGEPRRLARRLAHLGVLQFWLGRRAQARTTLWQALVQYPWTPATFGLLLASTMGLRAMRIAERTWPRYAGMTP